VFPTHVGMNRNAEMHTIMVHRVPHACGDEPCRCHLPSTRAQAEGIHLPQHRRWRRSEPQRPRGQSWLAPAMTATLYWE